MNHQRFLKVSWEPHRSAGFRRVGHFDREMWWETRPRIVQFSARRHEQVKENSKRTVTVQPTNCILKSDSPERHPSHHVLRWPPVESCLSTPTRPRMVPPWVPRLLSVEPSVRSRGLMIRGAKEGCVVERRVKGCDIVCVTEVRRYIDVRKSWFRL